MKYARWKSRQRKELIARLGLASNASYINISREIVRRFPRIQFDAFGGLPSDKEGAAEFVAFANSAIERNPRLAAE